MELFSVVLAIFFFTSWFYHVICFIQGVFFQIPEFKPSNGEISTAPKVSLIFAARDESVNVLETIRSLLAQDYPSFEVIAVNDRSNDDTLARMQSLSRDARLKILNIQNLPEGWTGKNHALYQGYRASSGGWLLFTDADVVFHPRMLASVLPAAEKESWDHLVVIPKMIYKSLMEAAFTNCFILAFHRRFQIWRARDPRSKRFVGMGAFNLVRRNVYEAIGTHEALRLQTVDDMLLGKRIKERGFRQCAMSGPGLAWVRWIIGFRGVVKSIEKNAFSALNYELHAFFFIFFAAVITDILPFIFLFTAHGTAFYLSGLTVLQIGLCYAVLEKKNGTALITFPFHPFSSLLVLVLIAVSVFKACARGGVEWRGTFYPLSELKKRHEPL